MSITDTGIGIDPAPMGKLFDDFTQVHERTGRDFGGTGLGLAISKRLIELHGGRISVKRRPVGGTIFEFTLRFVYLDDASRQLDSDVARLVARWK